MPRNEKDTLPPPYSELSPPHGQTILDQLTLTRAHHIQSVIDTHILPLVETNATYGIAQTTIALLPSDMPLPAPEEKSEYSFDDTSSTVKPVEVIGFSSQDEPKLVRLAGQMNRTEFWRSQGVIAELERVLRERLNESTRLLQSSVKTVGRFARSAIEFETPLQQPRRGFLSRFVPSMGPEQRSPSGNPEVGTRQMGNGGLVLVEVRLEEVCFRTVTEFGLYDTLSKVCIVIRVDARC